jgi:hypothetical protein
VDGKSGAGGPSYLVDSWQETVDWIGHSHLAVFFLCTAISRFYLNMSHGDGISRMNDPALAVSGRKRTGTSSST